MSRRSVFCISNSRDQVDMVVNQIKYSGFSNKDISALIPRGYATSNEYHENKSHLVFEGHSKTKLPNKIGGALSWITSVSTLVDPEIGPIIAIGAISDMSNNYSTQSITSNLMHIGLSEFEAYSYEKKIKNGYILISVYADNYKEILLAQEIFDDCGASEIATTGKTSSHVLKKSHQVLLPKLRNLSIH